MKPGDMYKLVLLFALVPLLLLSSCSRVSNYQGIAVVQEFVRAVKAGDSKALEKIVSPSGLVVIRDFSSAAGTKGETVRTTYSAGDIPPDLQFAVAGETSIDLGRLFAESQEVDVNKVKVLDGGDNCFAFTDSLDSPDYTPTTYEVWGTCSKVTSPTTGDDPSCPTVFDIDGQEMVLTESTIASYSPVGAWAVFRNVDGKFYLRAILDLR